MAWVATADFEDLSTGNWNGQAGGSGWTGNWTKGGTGSDADFQIVSTPAIGSRAASSKNSVNGSVVTRSMASTVSGTFSYYFLVRRNSTSGSNGARIGVATSGGGTQYFVGFYGDAIRVFGATGTNVVTGLAADTWYEVNVEINTAASTYRARYRPRLGTWSAFTSSEGSDGGSTSAVAEFWCQQLGTDGTICYWDRISDTEESSGSTISVTDSVTIGESVALQVTSFINKTESVSIAESVGLTFALGISVSDSVAIAESRTVQNSTLGPISVAEAITIGESVTAQNSNLGGISVSDSVTITESVNATFVFIISVSDSVAIAETASVEASLGGISVSDSITITESRSLAVPEQRAGFAVMRGKDQEYPLGMDDSTIE